MKKLNLLNILVLGLAVGCAQAPRSPQLVQYQTKSAQILSAYSSAVSRGFGTSSKSSTRGVMDYGSYDSSIYNYWTQTNGNYLAKEQISQEVADCKAQISAVPKDCKNLGFMVSSLARCLDRVLTNQNPIFTYAYRQLDRTGQQYYTYLLDWRRPRPYQSFTIQDYQQWNPYAYSGWIPGSVTY